MSRESPRAWRGCAIAPGTAREGGTARLAPRPGAVALPPRRPARRHPGRTLAQTRAAVRAARVTRDRGDVARRTPAPGAAGTRADLRQVRTDPVDPTRPGACRHRRGAVVAAGSGLSR